MIRIAKPATVPKKLRTDGKKLRRINSAAYTRDPQSYISGKKTFEISGKVYGHDTVKRQLVAAQYGKCCFCESKILHVSAGDVEHFRPKGGSRQSNGGRLRRPGYYWLGYEWRNLFLSCERCNRREKGNLFPLKNPAKRATYHKGNVAVEAPVFIDPEAEDPEVHIGFSQEIAIDRTGRGKRSIILLGLNRPELLVQRASLLQKARANKIIMELLPGTDEARDAETKLNEFGQPEHEFSAMFKAFATDA